MLSGACVEREQIIVCAYDRVSYNDLGVGLVASSCGGSRPEQCKRICSSGSRVFLGLGVVPCLVSC